LVLSYFRGAQNGERLASNKNSPRKGKSKKGTLNGSIKKTPAGSGTTLAVEVGTPPIVEIAMRIRRHFGQAVTFNECPKFD